MSQTTSPALRTFRRFFDESITLAADVWTRGINLYEVLGERLPSQTLHERDDIVAR